MKNGGHAFRAARVKWITSEWPTIRIRFLNAVAFFVLYPGSIQSC